MPPEMFERYRDMVGQRIQRWIDELPATGLFEPMAYIMRLPAKRVRPATLLMSCEMFGGDPKAALDAALGIELFHNFTLMHDDIMDRAPLRRGMRTVHLEWNVNTAILSGDAMLVKAYELFAEHPQLLQVFNTHALAVCEGQQTDMEFEQRQDVSLFEYMEMIRRKTAMLLSCSMRMGAMIAGAGGNDLERIGGFGEQLGLAFQLRDDLLDAFGDPQKVGKLPGGDLRAGKKTWLLIRGLEVTAGHMDDVLRAQLGRDPDQRDINAMLAVLEKHGVRKEAEQQVALHERKALEAIDGIDVPAVKKEPLLHLAGLLMARTY